jgi:polyisoprenoid-binding protein YceI
MPRTTFIVDDPMTRNGVLVSSRAPLETILVRSNDVTGTIEIDPDDITASPRATFDVPVDSLDTGIALMNDVMRTDRWLDAAKSSSIRLTLRRIVSPSARTPLRDGQTVQIQGEATLDLRGTSTSVPVSAEVTWQKQSEATARRLPGDLLHVVARFDVPLSAIGIDSHLSAQTLGKVVDSPRVEVDVFASTERPQVGADMRERLAQARKSLGQRLLAS